MAVDYGKRAFFSRLIPTRPANSLAPLRPPGALDEFAFLDSCTGCGECVLSCGQNVLVRGAGGYPEIYFDSAECSLCGDCIARCEPGALSVSNQPWDYIASVKNQCLPKNGIACQSCQDHCDQSAIVFEYKTTVPTPKIETALCNGCGACVSTCPAKALTIYSPKQRGTN